MSPFLVTTKRPCHDCAKAVSCGGTGVLRVCECGMQSDMAEYDGACPYAVSSVAVETLQAARKSVQGGWTWQQVCDAIPESGGSVGPLPDGTLIQVERVSWREIGGEKVNASSHALQAELLATFNARQAS